MNELEDIEKPSTSLLNGGLLLGLLVGAALPFIFMSSVTGVAVFACSAIFGGISAAYVQKQETDKYEVALKQRMSDLQNIKEIQSTKGLEQGISEYKNIQDLPKVIEAEQSKTSSKLAELEQERAEKKKQANEAAAAYYGYGGYGGYGGFGY